MRSLLKIQLFLLFIILLVPGSAQAHKALFFVYMEGGELVAEGGFSGGGICKECLVKVFDAATEQEILRGKTDEQGIWRTPLPESANEAKYGLKIVLNGGEGHRAEWLLEAEEYLGGSTKHDQPQELSQQPLAPSDVLQPGLGVQSVRIDEEMLGKVVRQNVEAALDKKLAPIRRDLAKALDPGPTLSSVIGGLGWIVGVAGLLAWLRTKLY